MLSKIYFLFFVFSLYIGIASAQITYAPYAFTTTGTSTDVVTIGDLNNDGLNDVIVGNDFFANSPNNTNILVYYQNNSGGLNSPILYSYPQQYPGLTSLSLGDMNNDNLIDIVIGFGDSVGIFIQNVANTFNNVKSYYSGSNVYGVKVGDLNNDGLNDIAVCHWLEQYITIFRQTSTGFNYYTRPTPPGGRCEIDIGDVTNDGLNDVVFMSGSSVSGIHVFKQNGSTGFVNPSINYYPNFGGFGMSGIAIGDVNNDGRNDVVASKGGNQYDSQILLFYQDSVTGLLHSPDSLAAYDEPEPIVVEDIDCDGRNEIIVGHNQWEKVSVYQQNSLNHFSGHTMYNGPYSVLRPQSICVGDINNDGRKDIVFGATGLAIYLNNSTQAISSFTGHDTLVNIDTINHINSSNTSYYFSRKMVNSDTTCQVVQTDSFRIVKLFSMDSIRIDSNFIKTKMICSLYSDTVIHSNYEFNSTLISTDTLLIYTDLDTLYTPLVVVDTITHLNKFYTDTVMRYYNYKLEKTVVRSTGCSIIQNKIFRVTQQVVLDSLQFDSIFFRSAITCSVIYRDTLYQQKNVLDSVLLSSDTVLFSSSTDTLLSNSEEEFKLCNFLKVYPLPTTDFITLEVSDPCYNYYENKTMWLELYDTNAQLIFANTIKTKQLPIRIDMSNYANGIYCLKASVDKDFCIKKVIKEN